MLNADGGHHDDGGVGGDSDNDSDEVFRDDDNDDDEVNGPSSVTGKHKVTKHCWHGLVMRPELDALSCYNP